MHLNEPHHSIQEFSVKEDFGGILEGFGVNLEEVIEVFSVFEFFSVSVKPYLPLKVGISTLLK